MKKSKKEVFEEIKKKPGFEILSILSSLYNYLDFLDSNYKDLQDYYLKIQSQEQLQEESNNLKISFYTTYLDFSLHLLNHSTTAKALAEKCMGWRNHLRKHLSCDLNEKYENKLNEYEIIKKSEYFSDLRNKFLHKTNEEATRQYTINFKFKRGEGRSIQVFSKEMKKEIIPSITDYYNAQTQFTSWFIQEIRNTFSKELKEVQDQIKMNNIGIVIHPKVL